MTKDWEFDSVHKFAWRVDFGRMMGVELGIWRGSYMNQRLPWLRWWDLDGNLLLTGEERATIEQKRADLRAEATERRSELLAVKLRELWINSEDL